MDGVKQPAEDKAEDKTVKQGIEAGDNTAHKAPLAEGIAGIDTVDQFQEGDSVAGKDQVSQSHCKNDESPEYDDDKTKFDGFKLHQDSSFCEKSGKSGSIPFELDC